MSPQHEPVQVLALAVERCLLDLARAVHQFALSERPVKPVEPNVAKRDADSLLATAEAAKLIGWHENTLRRKRSRGEDSPAFVVVGRYRMYRQSDVDQWIAKHQRRPASLT